MFRWKENWIQTQERFCGWWNQSSYLVGQWESVVSSLLRNDKELCVPEHIDPETRLMDGPLRAKLSHEFLTKRSFPADILPVSETDLGPGSLCLYLGCNPEFRQDTVWFKLPDPPLDISQNLVFDLCNPWWQKQKEILEECCCLSQENYGVGIPDLVEGLDILASLRGAETLLIDLLERPQLVKDRLSELNQIYFDIYDQIYNIVKLPDDSSVFGTFRLWGKGKTAKLQSDISAMLSLPLFEEFVIPYITEQCNFLDHSMYHLDGTQCLQFLDVLLEIENLDAIEWTPQAGLPGGGDPIWYDTYKKILGKGKSVQVVSIKVDEIIPLFEHVGTNGVYVLTKFESKQQADDLMKQIHLFENTSSRFVPDMVDTDGTFTGD